MVLWVMLIMMILQSNVEADIFKENAEDGQLTSIFSGPYNYQRTIIKPMISTAINKDQEIQKSIDTLSKEKITLDLKNSHLVLLAYGAPAEADAYKHLQTVSYLRFMLDYERLRDLENNDSSELNALRKQAIYDCVQRKFTESFNNDISGLMDSCRSSVAFDGLNYADGKNIYEKLFNKVNLRGQKKEDILSILPVLEIVKGEIILNGPAKRIGHIIQINRDNNRKALNAVLDSYRDRKQVLVDHMKKLSIPGKPFTHAEVLDLLSLEERDRLKHIEKISAQLAISQSIERYSEAIEFLARYTEHPGFEGVYKDILRRAINYLEREKDSLKQKLEDMNDYSTIVSQMAEASDLEQKKTLKDYKAQEQYKALLNL
jgi:hypothetical protein